MKARVAYIRQAAIGKYSLQRIREAVIVNALLNSEELLPNRCRRIGFYQQAVEPGLLAHHRTNLRGKVDRDFSANLPADALDDFPGSSFVNRIQIGKKEADAYGVNSHFKQFECCLSHFLFIKGNDRLTKHVDPLGNTMNPTFWRERFRMYMGYRVQGICIPIASPNEAAIHQQHILEAICDQQAHFLTTPRKQSIEHGCARVQDYRQFREQLFGLHVTPVANCVL